MPPAPDLAALFESAPCGLLLLDRHFNVRHANAHFLDLAGLDRGALDGALSFSALLSVAGRIFLQTRLQQELALAGRVEELALDLVRPDGARVPVMLNAVQRPGDDGVPGDIQMSLWRAAAKRAYEAEVPKARLAAAEAAQVKSDFLANISHEIRTPLNGVIGAAAVLARTGLNVEQQSMVALIRASGETLTQLVSDVLDISKVQAGRLELEPVPFDLMAELGGVLEMARLQAAGKDLAFSAVCAPQARGRYLGDAVRLKQVLARITDNAVKFTHAGQVAVDIGLDPTGALAIQVRDTGIGFDEATAETLFQRFSQADTGATRQYGGAGLGLSIGKALVDLMGGTITARSTLGQGSVFTLTLPLPRLEAEPDADPPPESDPDQADGPALRVLLVEDNPTNQKVVSLILGAFGVDLTIADNGRLGVDAWAAGAYDVVLMDLQMPVMDGLAAIREIRTLEAGAPAPRRTPIVVLSANAMDHHRREALDAGADIHVAKPVTPEALIQGIETAMAAAA